MQIDFHHATLSHEDASVVAYCSQYVDDATNEGTIEFDNGAHYTRISSAHKLLDYRNTEELANSKVWIPFHFLPGNGGKAAGENPSGRFVEKLVCRPDSYVSHEMVRNCIENKHLAYGLHRLGITMHVYADTWAHQGFAGIENKINAIHDLDDEDRGKDGTLGKLKDFFGDVLDEFQSDALGTAFPLGHGAALSYPDRPWLKWNYLDWNNERVARDNTALFLDASDHLCMAIKRYIAGNPDADVDGLPSEDKQKIETLFDSFREEDGEERHEKWLEKIREGYFSFGPVELRYVPKGPDSWKHLALRTEKETDDDDDTFPYEEEFLNSNWKLFHDAIQAHRFVILHDILPKYGICTG